MGINKFTDELDDVEEVKIPNKNFKKDVDEKINNKFRNDELQDVCINLLDMDKSDKAEKKIPMTMYFKEEDLKLLKAISNFKETTVNKTVMSILETPLNITRNNLPSNFDIDKLSIKYDKSSKQKKSKR